MFAAPVYVWNRYSHPKALPAGDCLSNSFVFALFREAVSSGSRLNEYRRSRAKFR